MMHHDLGQLDHRMLLFGGPYSNLQATQALFAQAGALGIAPAQMMCTGDIVAYCADAVATTALIRASGMTVVAGNCEKQLAVNALDCGCGFEEGTTCDVLSAGWYAHANAQVGQSDRSWMGTLPDIVTFDQAGKRFAVIHGGCTNISRFLWPVSPDAAFAEEIAAIENIVGPVDGIIAGHCGIPFVKETGGKVWINAGVIGMPPHDGAQDTRFMVLSEGQVTLHHLAYDAPAAQAAMIKAGLTQGYQTALLSGVWPSEDVLPPELRRAE